MPFTSVPPMPKPGPMPEMKLEFERMAERHLPEVLAIERASFSDPWSETMFRQELEEQPGKYSIVLSLDSLVIGYGIGWIVADEFHLGNLAVMPDHKGRGYGRMILERMIKTARKAGCRIATLEVRVSNVPAISLYHKFEFKEMAVRKKYYQDEDALVLLARLDGEEAC
jgi:[ribosomal protein S18]-alanine N-acetyltransferase